MLNKNILLCVCGGVAVFKAAALTSKLVQQGANVKVIMTNSAMKFITPLTFQVLSRNEVYVDTFNESNPEAVQHIDLAKWADITIIAPATANVIGKIANGIADDMLTTTIMATVNPVIIAPAMNVNMYNNKIVQENIDRLKKLDYIFFEPSEGLLACGDIGKGRLLEPEDIIKNLNNIFNESNYFNGKKILITAGPTIEKIDPVRFISNFSSGKMGYALAEQAARFGADVTLISGPTKLPPPKGIRLININSAEEMFEAVKENFELNKIIIKSAAVADYTPITIEDNKIKKKSNDMILKLKKTTDILKWLGDNKSDKVLIGFAAETNNVLEYAQDKLQRKNLDYIIVNDVSKEGAGFNVDTNIATLISRDGTKIDFPLLSKKDLAKQIMEVLYEKVVKDYDTR
ncbi:MAG: bifunctional phosphopantothenoylcysteine decarboxylase/phosphopantothenate synthase [Bacillales bacterium]|jgi:phosphopantothenoylcysteine decarboxylase/phosphopantothenate--cysteine ligase|nr:bifunctional phosphopantothenoylcysteine decarboxylase/phosphopantothenate synthase [Bacillales bacterium]